MVSLLELSKLFETKDACLEFLERLSFPDSVQGVITIIKI